MPLDSQAEALLMAGKSEIFCDLLRPATLLSYKFGHLCLRPVEVYFNPTPSYGLQMSLAYDFSVS